jgi:hypothetical protein
LARSISQDQAYLFRERKLSPGTIKGRTAALRFLFIKTLRRPYLPDHIPSITSESTVKELFLPKSPDPQAILLRQHANNGWMRRPSAVRIRENIDLNLSHATRKLIRQWRMIFVLCRLRIMLLCHNHLAGYERGGAHCNLHSTSKEHDHSTLKANSIVTVPFYMTRHRGCSRFTPAIAER